MEGSVLGYDVRVNSYCDVKDSIIYNHVDIGRYSKIRNAIIDRHVSLPEHTEYRVQPGRGPKEIFREREGRGGGGAGRIDD